MEEIVIRYLATWNDTDAKARRGKIEEVFSSGCAYTDPMAAVSGHAGLDGLISAVQDQFKGVELVLAGRVDAHHDVARFTWHAVTRGSRDPLAIGFDVIVVEGGRIKQVVGFLDKAPG
jgi:hypothetical protein